MDLADTRESIADALTAAVEDLHVRPRGPVRSPKQGDGWVTIGRMVPADYCRTLVTLVTVIALSADDGLAEELLDTWAVPAIDAVTKAEDLNVTDVAVEPVSLLVEQTGATLHAMTVTLTTEVEA